LIFTRTKFRSIEISVQFHRIKLKKMQLAMTQPCLHKHWLAQRCEERKILIENNMLIKK